VRKNFLFFLYLILSLLLIAGGNEARNKKAVFLNKIAFFSFINSVEEINSLFKIKHENKLLSEKLAVQTNKVVALENLLDRIKNTDIQYEAEDFEFVIADIIGFTGIFQERNLIINKGITDKIHINSPVISNTGIVGKIISNSLNYSIILPLNHSSFKVGVMCKRSHLQGIMKSDAYGNSFMNLIKLGSDIAVGDTIVTSNISTIFPKGYPVGIITKLREAPDQIYMYANLQTFIDPASLDQVIVLDYKKEINYESEIQDN
jgi:rod shape-determining protein MreC